jgi:hypothetical protein
MTEFRRRQIGHTGLWVTELGLGCATLGGSQIAEHQWATVQLGRTSISEPAGGVARWLGEKFLPSRPLCYSAPR